ncbi:FKBP-type peptidyl-prolyl cis-trans isomerase [Helicosporidium sp. ATCC 50920]|nr:FKBP-type peptidyl-prolyl cis-trans isomerase [Helicosporidium sp. ATCC 50920]|eukprot:KDD74096.1 FKBP-type peptidyl-prolyl cis-trans isomerase [Helicosporidium sp. ATCC 50920]
MSFWGVVVHPGKSLPVAPLAPGCQIHISQACIESQSDAQRAYLKIAAGSSPEPLLLASLTKAREGQSLDIVVDEPVELLAAGSAPVHVTGYHILPEEADEGDSEDEEFAALERAALDSDEDDELDGEFDSEMDDESDSEMGDEFDSEEEEEPRRSGVIIEEIEDDVVTGAGGMVAAAARKTRVVAALPAPEPKKRAAEAKPEAKPAKQAKAEPAKKAPEPAKKAPEPAKKAPEPAKKAPEPAKAATTPAKPKKQVFPNGFVIETLKAGAASGSTATAGKSVSVKYVGRLKATGKIFDQTRGSKTFTFRLGAGEVIKGWDRGVEGMKVGEKRKLEIPPPMGYGSGGVKGTIPPNATLVFDVELVKVK